MFYSNTRAKERTRYTSVVRYIKRGKWKTVTVKARTITFIIEPICPTCGNIDNANETTIEGIFEVDHPLCSECNNELEINIATINLKE